MKTSLNKRIIVLVMALAVMLPAVAQFRIGPRIGTEVNSMRLDKATFDNDNRAGFTGGLMCEFTVPVINVGFDLSVMYVHRVSNSSAINDNNLQEEIKDVITNKEFRKRDYIEIPLNLKYKFGLPVVGKVFTPYIFTGPSFSFLVSKKNITSFYKNRNLDVAWNIGVGVQLFSHLQIGASYAFGMNKTIELINDHIADTSIATAPIEGKNNYWTITAAWLF